MPNFTSIERQKIKKALIRCCFEGGGSWNKLHYQMRAELNMQDNDKRLHVRDPRNFCVDNIEATDPKLALYKDYLEKIEPGIDLSDEDNKFNEVGLALSEFTIGNQACSSKENFKAAIALAGKLYLSKSYHGISTRSSIERLHLFLCRAEKKNPFLRVAEMIVTFDGDSPDNELDILNDEILSEDDNPRHKIISLHTGILCPVKINEIEMLYHGISKSPNGIPVHQVFMSFTSDGPAIVNRLHDPFAASETLHLKTIADYPNIRKFLETRLDTLI